jgi:hypothetical protein
LTIDLRNVDNIYQVVIVMNDLVTYNSVAYTVHFEKIQQACTSRGRFNMSLYQSRLDQLQKRYKRELELMSLDSPYRNQLVENLVQLETEIEWCEKESEKYW